MSRCCVYDFTMWYPKDYIPVLDSDEYLQGIKTTRKILSDISKKYCFQLEKGEKSGRYHLQGRFSLKMKDTIASCAEKLQELGWADFKLTHTSNENRSNNFYVSKEETREDGPFDDTNDVYVPREVLKMKVLRPWQESLKKILTCYDERGIHVVIDPLGGIGKSMFVKYMCILHGAAFMPFCKEYRDVMRLAYDMGPASLFLIDLPRAISAKNLGEMLPAMEVLKIGFTVDDRFHCRKRWTDNVNVCIFMNDVPPLTSMTNDRWRLWRVNKKMELKRYRNKLDYVDKDYDSDQDTIIPSSSSESESDSTEDSDDIVVSRDLVDSSEEESSEKTKQTKKRNRSNRVCTISTKKRSAKK